VHQRFEFPNEQTNKQGAPMPSTWDWPLEAPVSVKVKARPFNWPDAWLLPTKPVAAGDTTGPTQDLVLIPYGKSFD
jgi:hypothetical protein